MWADLGEVKSHPKHLSAGSTCLSFCPHPTLLGAEALGGLADSGFALPPTLTQTLSQVPHAFQPLNGHRDSSVCLSWSQGAGRLPGWGQLGRALGLVGAATVLILKLIPCPHLGQETHALGAFPSLSPGFKGECNLCANMGG